MLQVRSEQENIRVKYVVRERTEGLAGQYANYTNISGQISNKNKVLSWGMFAIKNEVNYT